jgi:hypothetical protein
MSPAERARDLIVFCDGFDEGGLYPGFTRRARMVARDLLVALGELERERSARRAVQERCERQQAILGRHADDAMRRAIESNSPTHTRHAQRGAGA